MSIEQLRDEILSKKPVIHTRFAEQLITEPHDVESAYNQHYHTHVPLGDTSDFVRRLTDRVTAARTPKGAVVAPWGYGKTSTLIFTWKMCDETGILTVPPFICSSLQDILNATYGWLRFRLGSDYHGELESVYSQYGCAAFEERARIYADQTGVTEADARTVLQSAMDDGSFTPELTPINLMKFLEYATELAGRAGFNGLVILADELQEFFDKSADVRGTIQRMRDVVWWLAAHGNLPLGVILCMPDGTQSIIQEDGQDILDRLKTDRLYVSLRNIYNPDFPRQLWERYVEIYEANAQADQVIDSHALTATGQIATRADLGRGPRTVIDVFQCALRHHDKTQETYSPLALIDDFLTGQISFDMQGNPIRFAVEDALSLLKNQITTDAHRRAIKLWAAFPEHGCPDEVLDVYTAKEAAYELSEMHGVHGPLLTYQSVGYTLRKLASFTPGGTAVERIARDFWLAYKEQDSKWAEAAQAAFIEDVLPRIFEKRRNAWGSWDLDLTTAKGYAGRLTGTFSDQYPNRILDIQVAAEPTRIEPRQPDARSDFQFDFVLQPREGTEASRDPGCIEYVAGDPRWIRFDLNLGNRSLAGANLPQDLLNLKSSIHPNFLTPQLMLAFVDYAERWESLKPDNRILESEHGPVKAILESMINYSVRVLFSEELKASFNQKLNFTGLQIIREIFVLVCQAAWPPDTYHPLLTISDRAFGDYLDALTKLPLRQKRGDVPLNEQQKGKIARLFGIGSHKAFENRAKSDYAHLMQYRDLGGDQAQVRLQFHPLEAAVLREMTEGGKMHRIGERDSPALEGSRLLTLADASGYRDEEAAMTLKLLVARELVDKDDQTGRIYRTPAGPSPQEVDQRLTALHTHVHGLPAGLVVDREKDPLVRHVEALRDRFSPEMEEEALEEMAIEVGRVEADMTALVNRKRQSLLDELAEHVQDVQQLLGALNRATELEEDVPVGLDFRRHLMDLQEALRGKRQKLTRDLNKVCQQLKDLHDRVAAGLEVAAFPGLYQEYERVDSRVRQLIEQGNQLDKERKGLIAWFRLLKESDQLYKSLVNMPDLRGRLTDEVVPEIKRNFTLRFGQEELMALAGDAELFRDQFDEIARERDSRAAAGHEAFGEVKERYRQWLATMGLERSDFHAHYSQVDHELSYQDMCQQVQSLAISHLDHLDERFDSIDLDLRKARKIHLQKLSNAERTNLTDLEKRRTELERDLTKAREWLRTTDLAQAGDLDEQAEAIAEGGRETEKVGQDIRELMRQIPPQTPEEQKVMALLSERREVDLTELVLSAGEELDLSALVAGLVGLYQGNQVRIKVQRWS